MPAPRDAHLAFEWGSAFAIEKDFPRTQASAAMVAAELRRIQGDEPVLEPRRVVQESRPVEAKLHGAFCWDNEVAAERWRERQAQDLQRGVRVCVVTRYEDGKESRSEPMACYASFKPSLGPRGYREVVTSMSRPDHRSALLQEALRELAAFRRRYAALTELADLMRSIGGLLGGLDETG